MERRTNEIPASSKPLYENTISKENLHSTLINYENVIRHIYNAYQPLDKLHIKLSDSNSHDLDREMYVHIVSGDFMGPHIDSMSAFLLFIMKDISYKNFALVLNTPKDTISVGTFQLMAFLYNAYLRTHTNRCLNPNCTQCGYIVMAALALARRIRIDKSMELQFKAAYYGKRILSKLYMATPFVLGGLILLAWIV